MKATTEKILKTVVEIIISIITYLGASSGESAKEKK
jgi:hypothetical protein